jgi:hypothetical protein
VRAQESGAGVGVAEGARKGRSVVVYRKKKDLLDWISGVVVSICCPACNQTSSGHYIINTRQRTCLVGSCRMMLPNLDLVQPTTALAASHGEVFAIGSKAVVAAPGGLDVWALVGLGFVEIVWLLEWR